MERLYRTGKNLARHLHNGKIEFLGLNDDQVKITGIGSNELKPENALKRHPRIFCDGVLRLVKVKDESEVLVADHASDAEEGEVSEIRAKLKEFYDLLKKLFPAFMYICGNCL